MRKLIRTAEGELQVTDVDLSVYPGCEVLQEDVPMYEFMKVVNNKIVEDKERIARNKKLSQDKKEAGASLLEKYEKLEARLKALENKAANSPK